jgi:DNA-binding LacI/PurR family transcriptional regulator
MNLSHGIDRLASYRDAIDRFDPALVAHGDYSYASGMAATERLLRQVPDIDVLFVASDVMAAGASPLCTRPGGECRRTSPLPVSTTPRSRRPPARN